MNKKVNKVALGRLDGLNPSTHFSFYLFLWHHPLITQLNLRNRKKHSLNEEKVESCSTLKEIDSLNQDQPKVQWNSMRSVEFSN